MSENILTILLWLVFILLFCIRYVLPLAVAALGIYLVKKEKDMGTYY